MVIAKTKVPVVATRVLQVDPMRIDRPPKLAERV